MAAAIENKNASKDAADKAESFLHIRCKTSDKSGWVRAAAGRPLAEWVIKTLNAEAGKDEALVSKATRSLMRAVALKKTQKK